MDSVSVSVPVGVIGVKQVGGGNNVEKKLRKRKELDAMVAKKRGGSAEATGSGGNSNVLVPNTESETSDSGFGLRSNLIHQSSSSAIGGGGLMPQKTQSLDVGAFSLCFVTCRGLWMSFVAAASFIVVLTVLGMHVQMKVQIAQFGSQLDKVVGQRNELEDKYSSLRVQMQDLLANQTHMKLNQTRLKKSLEKISSQILLLNASLSSVTKSLAAAPELKTLPAEVTEIRTEVAKIGSRIAELESNVKTREVHMRSTENELQKLLTLTSSPTSSSQIDVARLRSDVNELDTRLNTVGTSIAGQLEDEQKRSQKSWTLLSDLQTSMQNLSDSLGQVESNCCSGNEIKDKAEPEN